MLKLLVALTSLGVTLSLPTNSTDHDVAPRIVGGDETSIDRNPWQLALLYNNEFFCAGVEIHPQWAITAAHCLTGVSVGNLSVRAGSTTKSFGGQIIDVVNLYIHPKFDPVTVDYDFALLELLVPISIKSAAPVGVPDPNYQIIPRANAIITGWGSTYEGGPTVEIFRLIRVQITDRNVCQITHPSNNITDRMFCAGELIKGGKYVCQGDDGGPVDVGGKIVGLVSWGLSCGRPNSPGVYAKISSVADWIYETTGI